MTTSLPQRESYEWLSYTYRPFSEEAQADFASWLILHDWSDVLQAECSTSKAVAYQNDLDVAMDVFFPLRTTKRKSTDLPWINRAMDQLRQAMGWNWPKTT